MYNGANHREYHIPWIVSSIKHPMSPLCCSLQSRPGPPPEPEKMSHQHCWPPASFYDLHWWQGCVCLRLQGLRLSRREGPLCLRGPPEWLTVQNFIIVKRSRSRVQLRNCCICIASQSFGSNLGGGNFWTVATTSSAFRLEFLSRI